MIVKYNTKKMNSATFEVSTSSVWHFAISLKDRNDSLIGHMTPRIRIYFEFRSKSHIKTFH